MKVKIQEGKISLNGKIYKVGDVLEVPSTGEYEKVFLGMAAKGKVIVVPEESKKSKGIEEKKAVTEAKRLRSVKSKSKGKK